MIAIKDDWPSFNHSMNETYLFHSWTSSHAQRSDETSEPAWREIQAMVLGVQVLRAERSAKMLALKTEEGEKTKREAHTYGVTVGRSMKLEHFTIDCYEVRALRSWLNSDAIVGCCVRIKSLEWMNEWISSREKEEKNKLEQINRIKSKKLDR